MNKHKLRGVMYLNGDSMKDLADFLGMSCSSLSKRMNEKNSFGFTQPEIIKIKEKYSLNAEEVDSIFFETKVS